MEVPFERSVACAVSTGIYEQIYDDIGSIEDSNVNSSPEGGRLWLRLKDGRQITVNYTIKIEQPARDAQTEIM